MALTKASATIIARGSSNAAFTQLTGCSVTRSTLTATLTKTSHGRSNGDVVLIQGFSLEEFNGVFTVANAAANTFDYTIKQDPGANPAGTPGTVDKVTMGSAFDLTGAYNAEVFGGIQNGNTGPTVAAQIWMGIANGSAEADYIWSLVFAGDTTANSWSPFNMQMPMPRGYVNFAIARNTGQAVDAFLLAEKTTAV